MAKRKAAKKVSKKRTASKKAVSKKRTTKKKATKKKATKKKATKKAASKKVATKRTGPTVASVAAAAIRKGKTNEEVLAVIKKRLPKCSASLNSVAWYRNAMRKAGEDIPYSREISFKRKAKKRGAVGPRVKQRNSKAPIGDTIYAALRAGKTNAEALAVTLKKHKGARTTLNSVAWYRNDLRNQGEPIPYDWEILPARKAATAAKRKATAAAKKRAASK